MPLRSANLPLGRISQPRLLSSGPTQGSPPLSSLPVGWLPRPATRKFSLDYWLPITIQLPIFQEIRILHRGTGRKTGTGIILITREPELFSIRRISW